MEGQVGIRKMCLKKYCKCVDWIPAVWNFGVVTVLHKPREFLDKVTFYKVLNYVFVTVQLLETLVLLNGT